MFKKVVTGLEDIKRFEEILKILIEEGFGFLCKRKLFRKHEPLPKDDIPVRLRKVLEKLGPTFIKFGQLLSVRPDLVPIEYIHELEKLQANVRSLPFSVIQETLKSELGKDYKKLFRKIDEIPIASASISQVHRGILKNGKKVAIKVQRPNARKQMLTDINIMYHFARIIEKHYSDLRKFTPRRIVDEFSQWTKKELDFKYEARYASIFYRNFKGSSTVKIPMVFKDFSTSKILVTEFIDGIEIRNLKELKRKKIDIRKVIANGLDSILTQIFVFGFFHADPHPGNIMVLPSGKIAYVDFGIVGHFGPDLRKKSIDLFLGILNDDANRIVDTFTSMDPGKRDLIDFRRQIEDAILPLQSGAIQDAQVSKVLENILNIALNNGFKMPVDFILLGKTILTVEGVALEYDPHFDFVKQAKPFVKKIMKRKPVQLKQEILDTTLKYKSFIQEFPSRANRVLDRIEQGDIKLDIKDTDINRLTLEIDRSSNRISYGIVIAALLIGSSLVLNVNATWKFISVSTIALIGYVLAMILGIILLISILREGK